MYHEQSSHNMHGHPSFEELEAVHMTPEEVHHLNELQGGEEFTPHGYPMFRSLAHHLNHPHIHEHLHHASHHRRMAANGGHIGDMHHEPSRHMEEEERHHGVHGDTQLVYMPKHMTHLLDHMIGGEDRNPHDGKKQYWIGSLMSGIGNAVKDSLGGGEGGAGGILNTLMPIARQGLGNIARTGFQTAMQGMADPNFKFNREGFSNLGRNALSGMTQQGGREFNNVMAAMPEDTSDPNSFGGMARRSLGQIGRAGFQGAQRAMSDPSFNWRNGGVQSIARGAYGGARDNAFNQLGDAMRSPQSPEDMSAPDERYNPDSAPGGSFARSFGDRGSRMGSQYGRSYGSQLGSRVGAGADRGMNRMGGTSGYDPGRSAYMGRQAGQIANRYGSEGGGRRIMSMPQPRQMRRPMPAYDPYGG